MKLKICMMLGLVMLLLMACSGSDNNSASGKPGVAKNDTDDPMLNIGIGPISKIELAASINQELAETGKEAYNLKCTACHKIDVKFIGPPPAGIMERRNPVWIMNMILNPEEMILKDPIARNLFIEYNSAPMANQSLSEQEARAILEYFRTL